MTATEERLALAETLTFAKEKGLKIAWTNENIVVIHVRKKHLTDGQENQPQQSSPDQPIHGQDRQQGRPDEGHDESPRP